MSGRVVFVGTRKARYTSITSIVRLMARIRTIKPQFWLDQRLASWLTRDQRLFYIGLWNQADDEGRFVANPRLLLGVIFPYENDIDEAWITRALNVLAKHERIVLYSSDGEDYGEIVRWSEHQKINRPSKSYIPSSNNKLSTIHGGLTEGSVREKEKEREKSTDVRTPFSYPAEFETVWAIHHRGPKKQAYEAYRKAVANGIDHDGLLKAIKGYKMTLRDGFLGAHLFRWIRDERWQEQDGDDWGNGQHANPKARGRL